MSEVKTRLVSSTDDVEVHVFRDYGKPTVMTHTRLAAGSRMHFAMECVARWGMVAAVDDGEDSSGRAKVRLATPQELVNRAFAISELMHAKAEERGWSVPVPSYEDCVKALD